MTARPWLLVLRPLGLGDFLTGVPAYRAIARAFPEYRKVLAAPGALASLLDLAGMFDEIHDTRPLAALGSSLQRPDIAIDLHGRGPASHQVLLAAQPGRLIAFANDAIPQSAGGAQWREDEHEVARWCRMLSYAGIVADERELELAIPAVRVPVEVHGATVIHASAASESRRWPADRWAAVARAQHAAGRTVILTGDSSDIPLVTAIADGAELSREAVYAGRTNLRELAAFVAAAGRVVCGDTGIAHLATAYRTPSVILFGPIPPAWWGPPAARGYHRALWAGRRGDPHAARVDPGLLEISVDSVLAALADLTETSNVAAI